MDKNILTTIEQAIRTLTIVIFAKYDDASTDELTRQSRIRVHQGIVNGLNSSTATIMQKICWTLHEATVFA